MGLRDFFSKKNEERAPDPLSDLTLEKLGVGYFVDYDMKTWCVEACNHYDWGDGDTTYEWQLVSHDDTLYLERQPDDEDHWSVSWKIPIGTLGVDINAHVQQHDDPPDEIQVEGTAYHLDETGGGQFYKGGSQPGKDVLTWDYVDDSGESFLSIEQWGETEFEASIGKEAEVYQFDNILPAGEEDP
ncbi:MAG: DUF4178 domain-containing protein [Desulfobacterales bacterium]